MAITKSTAVSTQAVTKALTLAGFVSHISRRDFKRVGYEVRKVNSRAVAVDSVAHATTNEAAMEWSQKYEAALTAAGFVVERPFPDATILGIRARK